MAFATVNAVRYFLDVTLPVQRHPTFQETDS